MKPTPGPLECRPAPGDAQTRLSYICRQGHFASVAKVAMPQLEEYWRCESPREKASLSDAIQSANARLLAAAYNSYQKAFPEDPVAAAEADELGLVKALNAELLEALKKALPLIETAFMTPISYGVVSAEVSQILGSVRNAIAKAEGRL